LQPQDINLDWKEAEIVSRLAQGKKYTACGYSNWQTIKQI
jgi:hypothetical protein